MGVDDLGIIKRHLGTTLHTPDIENQKVSIRDVFLMSDSKFRECSSHGGYDRVKVHALQFQDEVGSGAVEDPVKTLVRGTAPAER
jgi:hypothetical protein